MKNNPSLSFGIGILLLVLIAGCVSETAPVRDVHLHADFAMYADGVKWNFAQEKYMTTNENDLSKAVHLHDMDGNVLHVHAANVTFGMFLESLGMKLETKNNPDGIGQEVCFTDDEGKETCYSRFGCYSIDGRQAICVDPIISAQSWRLFVNGEQLPEDMKMEDYVMKDLDQILLTNISFDGDLESQLTSITDNACIQSEKCPERGEPSDESSCAGIGDCGVGVIPTA
jgi:hypothetical protein